MDNFNNLVSGVPQPTDLVRDGWTDLIGKLLIGISRGDRPTSRPKESRARSRWPTSRRWRRSARASTRGEGQRRPPRRSSPTTVSSASGPAFTTSTSRPSTARTSRSSTRRDGRRADHREGRGRRRSRVRARLPDLRQRLRGRHRLLPARGPPDVSAAATRASARCGPSGVRTLHGMHVHGFPNCFLMSNAQAGFTANFPHMLNEQAKHLAYIIRNGHRRGRELDRGVTRSGAGLDRPVSSRRRARSATSSRTARPATTTTRASPASAARRTASTAAARPSSSASSRRGAPRERCPEW